MKHFKLNSFAYTALSIFVLAVFIFAGCSQSPLSSDSESATPHILQRSASFLSSAQFDPANLHAEKVISAQQGGQLTLMDVILDVPPGALDNDTLFSIDIPDINAFYNEFGTNGLVFKQPVKVTMSYRDADLSGVNENTIRIAWFNKATGDYEDVFCTVDFVNKTVTGYLNHFSAYALISD